MRAPTNSPPANPASVAAPTTKPWKKPAAAVTSVSATMIQSRTVTGGGAGYPPRRLGHAGTVTRGRRTIAAWAAPRSPAAPADALTRAPGLPARLRGARPVRRGLRHRRRRRRAARARRPGPRRALRQGLGSRRLRDHVLAADRGR